MSLHAPAERVAVEGADLQLNPQAAMSLSLLLHELATNAAKYGALSVEPGRVAVSWRVEAREEAVLHLDWRERGGPPARAPTRRGFGSRLIQNGLVGTRDATLDYADQGLAAEFRAPLAQVRAT
jgi:two-component sensor histidine kinase